MSKWTTLAVYKETRDKLEKLGKKGESFDEILNKLMNKSKNNTVGADLV